MFIEDIPANVACGRAGWVKTALICVLILLLGASVTSYIFFTEPTAQRTGATKETAMLVDVIEAEKGTFRPTIVALGTVRPAKDIILQPRVSGEIIERSDKFTPGGFVEKGETLLRVDPADYENALRQRESDLAQAEADLKIEMGRQNVARKEYELIDENLSDENRALVLRSPQYKSAKSRVESARAAVDQAELDLERTAIAAPFDAQVLMRNVNIGSQVSPGDSLARLVGLNTYWVEATVPLSKLLWLNVPDKPGEKGAEVRVRNRSAWPEGLYRTGYLYKIIGELEEETRLARVLVAVEDPLAREKESSDVPGLMIGSFVEARMKAREISDVIRLSRDYVRQDNTVWVMADGRLSIRDVEIIFQDVRYAYISEGLSEGDQVVTTSLTTVTENARLRLKRDETGSAPDSEGDAEPSEKAETQASGDSAE